MSSPKILTDPDQLVLQQYAKALALEVREPPFEGRSSLYLASCPDLTSCSRRSADSTVPAAACGRPGALGGYGPAVGCVSGLPPSTGACADQRTPASQRRQPRTSFSPSSTTQRYSTRHTSSPMVLRLGSGSLSAGSGTRSATLGDGRRSTRSARASSRRAGSQSLS